VTANNAKDLDEAMSGAKDVATETIQADLSPAIVVAPEQVLASALFPKGKR